MREEDMYQAILLPYALDALEPYYSKETLSLHYNILYKGYVDNVNKTNEKLKKARQTNDFTNIKCLEKDLSFFGSGAILHTLFFQNMISPKEKKNPSVNLLQQITKDFESFNAFKNQFNEASKAVEASRMVSTSIGARV